MAFTSSHSRWIESASATTSASGSSSSVVRRGARPDERAHLLRVVHSRQFVHVVRQTEDARAFDGLLEPAEVLECAHEHASW